MFQLQDGQAYTIDQLLGWMELILVSSPLFMYMGGRCPIGSGPWGWPCRARDCGFCRSWRRSLKSWFNSWMSLLRFLISLSQKATSSSSDRMRFCSKYSISASSSLSLAQSASRRCNSSSRRCSWSSLTEEWLSLERECECSEAGAVVRKENLLFWGATRTLCRLLTQTPYSGSVVSGQQHSICYIQLSPQKTHHAPRPTHLCPPIPPQLLYLMEEALAAIDNYPLQTILREDDHLHRRSAYFQLHSATFPFQGYHYGNKQLRQAYGITPKLYRYFNKRHFLFSKFDQGIQIDEESWYSVIPQPVALHLLNRLKKAKIRKVFEPFCGVGGIAVHLAGHFQEYVVNDIDKNKLEMLEHNLGVYGKDPSQLTILNQDFLQVEPFTTDAVIICPPWGGIDTNQYACSPLDDIMRPPLTPILTQAAKFSRDILLQMPKQTNIRNLITVAHQADLQAIFTIEKIETNEKCSQLFFYFGRKAFTGIDITKLEGCLLRDLNSNGRKLQRKLVKSVLKDSQTGILKELYKAIHPNKRTLLS